MSYLGTDNTPVYWEVQKTDGTWFSLHTYAWSVKSFGGSRFFSGPKRGDNIQLPHRRGRLYMPKSREAQTYDINMWVFPTNTDGSKDLTKTVEQKAHENWRKIVDAVDQEGQFRLRKRWYTDDSIKENFTTDIASAIAMAEFLDGSGPDSDDGRGYYVNLTFSLADPYFYDKQLVDGYSAATKAGEAVTLTNNGTTTIDLDGDVISDHIWISLASMGSTDPRIIFPDGNWVQILSSAMSDQTSNVVVDCKNATTIRKSLSSYLGGDHDGTYLNGLVRRNPYFQNWPVIDPTKPSENTITVQGSGTIKLLYDAAYR